MKSAVISADSQRRGYYCTFKYANRKHIEIKCKGFNSLFSEIPFLQMQKSLFYPSDLSVCALKLLWTHELHSKCTENKVYNDK